MAGWTCSCGNENSPRIKNCLKCGTTKSDTPPEQQARTMCRWNTQGYACRLPVVLDIAGKKWCAFHWWFDAGNHQRQPIVADVKKFLAHRRDERRICDDYLHYPAEYTYQLSIGSYPPQRPARETCGALDCVVAWTRMSMDDLVAYVGAVKDVRDTAVHAGNLSDDLKQFEENSHGEKTTT